MKYDIESIEKRKKTEKTVKRIIFIILIILIYNFVLLFLSLANKIDNVSLFGYKAFIITTNSMEPQIKIGDVIITKKINEDEIKEGDIITFSIKDKEMITHRVSKIEKSGNETFYTTRGDNNNVEDKEKITINSIVGKKVLIIPKMGVFIGALENKIILLVVLLVILILLFSKIQKDEVKDNRRRKKKIEEDKKNKYE